MDNRNQPSQEHDTTEPSKLPPHKQEQSDPQLTELRGFADKNEDLEPTLTDGTKAPDKAPAENAKNNI